MPQTPKDYPKVDNQAYKLKADSMFHAKKAATADSLAKKYSDIADRSDNAGNFFGGNTTERGSYFRSRAKEQQKIAGAHKEATKKRP